MNNKFQRYFLIFLIFLITVTVFNIVRKDKKDIKIDSQINQLIDTFLQNDSRKFNIITIIDPFDFNCPPCFENLISYLQFVRINKVNNFAPIFIQSGINDSLLYFKTTKMLINFGIDMEFIQLNNFKKLDGSVVLIINNKKEIIHKFDFPVTEENKKTILSYINN